MKNTSKKPNSKRLHIYINCEDYLQLQKSSKYHGITISAFIRNIFLSENHINLVEKIDSLLVLNNELIYHLKKCGTNLNQIAFHLNKNIKDQSINRDIQTNIETIKEILNEYQDFIKAEKLKLPKIKIRKNRNAQ